MYPILSCFNFQVQIIPKSLAFSIYCLKKQRKKDGLFLFFLLGRLAHLHMDNTVLDKREETEGLPAVQMWQEEWGAQAMPLTQARWLLSLATGVHGTRTSKITTWDRPREKCTC